MLVLGSCLGIWHKNPHLLSYLVSSHRCKPLTMFWFRTLSDLIAFVLSTIWHLKFLLNIFVFFVRSAGICSRSKNLLTSLQTSTWLFVFSKESTRLTCQSPLTVILYDPRTASANKNSPMGVKLSNISRAPAGVPEKASSGKQVSALLRLSSLDTFCGDRQPRTPMHTLWLDVS